MPDYPLPSSTPAELGFAQMPLEHLDHLIRGHVEEGRYPGAQIALARHGKLALFRTYGDAKTGAERAAARDDTLFLLFSQTKVLTSSAVWALIEEGKLSFMDKITDHLPEFKAHGKADITLHTVMTHQAGYPSGDVTQATWADHAKMRAEVCDFSLDWTPGSRLQYHPRAAHLTQAMVIEAVTGLWTPRRDPREGAAPRSASIATSSLGVPREKQGRCADTYVPPRSRDNSPEFKAAGMPSGGGYATARGIAAFYQMLLGKGRLGTVRMFSPRLVEYVTRSHTGDRGDHAMDGIPMHRGLGPHVRGDSERIRGLGTIGAPETFGHGGAGTSYSWADPTSGVSFTYLTNGVQPDPWHSLRLDRVANLVHAAID